MILIYTFLIISILINLFSAWCIVFLLNKNDVLIKAIEAAGNAVDKLLVLNIERPPQYTMNGDRVKEVSLKSVNNNLDGVPVETGDIDFSMVHNAPVE